MHWRRSQGNPATIETATLAEFVEFIGNPDTHKAPEGTFSNHSKKRLWSEEECRVFLNAALIYLAAQQPDKRLVLPVDGIFDAAQEMGSVAMALSDDDTTLTITGMGMV